MKRRPRKAELDAVVHYADGTSTGGCGKAEGKRQTTIIAQVTCQNCWSVVEAQSRRIAKKKAVAHG